MKVNPVISLSFSLFRLLAALESPGWWLVGFSETGGRINLWQRPSLILENELQLTKLPFPTLADSGG